MSSYRKTFIKNLKTKTYNCMKNYYYYYYYYYNCILKNLYINELPELAKE